MRTWAMGLVVIFIALAIPIFVFALDAPLFRRFRSRAGGNVLESGSATPDAWAELAGRLERLEDDVDDLHRSVRELRDDTLYLQGMIQQLSEEAPSDRSGRTDT
ncbi:MAG: hypothetical protein ACE5PT_14495 [Gemmatimonadales bacterium]